MTIASRASNAVLSLACAAAACYVYESLPNWQVPTLVFSLSFIALALVLANRPIGYSVGQLTLFLMLLIATAFLIGDYETPDPQPLTNYPYSFLAIFCVAFIVLAGVLRKAQAEMIQIRGQEA